jgi:hypothetical protein
MAVGQGAAEIMKYRSSIIVARLEPAKYELPFGISPMAWSADATMLAVSGAGWVGGWLPFEQPRRFMAVELPFSETVDALAIRGRSLQVVYAKGREIMLLDMPQVSLLTKWEAFLSQVPQPVLESGFKGQRQWEWNVTPEGYDGVHTYEEGHLLWFSHSHNPHAGGAAAEQSFASLLEDGPSQQIPEPILIEVCQAVQVLTSSS